MTNKILPLIIIILLGIVIYLQISPSPLPLPYGERCPKGRVRGWTADKQREYANKLKAENLNKEAIVEYEKYLGIAKADPETQANIYYTIGKMAEELGEYENALAYFYKVELIFPETKIKQELGEHMIACLEKMGRGLDAQRALEKRTALEPQKETGGKVIARIGKEQITDIQLNKELEKLPDWMKGEYKKPEKKLEFLKQYIAMELLSRKAKRLGYDKDPDIRLKLDDILKELMIQKLLEKELQDKIKITPDQIELYYKANKDKYFEPAKVKISYISAESEDKLKEIQEYKGIKDWVEEGNEYISDIGESKELTELAFKTEPQNTAGPVKVGDKFYMIKILEKTQKIALTFEEVKDKVSYEYQLERQKVVYQGLLEETLKAEDVEIFTTEHTENETEYTENK